MNRTGGALEERNVSRSWRPLRRVARAQGVRPLRLHDGRHTFASLTLAGGSRNENAPSRNSAKEPGNFAARDRGRTGDPPLGNRTQDRVFPSTLEWLRRFWCRHTATGYVLKRLGPPRRASEFAPLTSPPADKWSPWDSSDGLTSPRGSQTPAPWEARADRVLHREEPGMSDAPNRALHCF